MRDSLHADLARGQGELQAALEAFRLEMTEQARAESQASRSRAASVRRDLERLRDEHKTRIDEAENAIANGSINASALQEDVRARCTARSRATPAAARPRSRTARTLTRSARQEAPRTSAALA